jgi:hypothetical protein
MKNYYLERAEQKKKTALKKPLDEEIIKRLIKLRKTRSK